MKLDVDVDVGRRVPLQGLHGPWQKRGARLQTFKEESSCKGGKGGHQNSTTTFAADGHETMNTIEPRLISFLHSDAHFESYPSSPSLELPPLQDPNILKASGRLVLEPDASKQNGTPQHSQLGSSVAEKINGHKRSSGQRKGSGVAGRALGNSSPQALRKILDDGTGNAGSLPSKKRSMTESNKDDFVQLPQPPKKQKAAKQVVPPIIQGLFEPPPQAALFPPISSSSFHDSHGRNTLNPVLLIKPQEVKRAPRIEEVEVAEEVVVPVVGPKAVSKEKSQKSKKDVKARKKWTEEETNNLLLGVSKHGIGRWTDIIEDSSFSFNNRSAVDLKDRFRTCCPAELRGKPLASRQAIDQARNLTQKSKSSLMSENILIDYEAPGRPLPSDGVEVVPKKGGKSRAHRKKLEDLAQIGIAAPFKSSLRRERRPFTPQDDYEIELGYAKYGPAWTRIQSDSQFHLQSRQATDLRDRWRNMTSEKTAEKSRAEGTATDRVAADSLQGVRREKETSPTLPISLPPLQSSSSREGLRIHHIISETDDTAVKMYDTGTKTYPLQPQVSNFSYRDNYLPYPEQPSDNLAPFEWPTDTHFPSSIGEIGTSRLGLHEPWEENAATSKERPSVTDISSLLSSNNDSLNHVTSYYEMLLGTAEPIGLNSSLPLNDSFSS